MLASMVWEFRINPIQALIETISARETPENSWTGDKCELQGFKGTRTGKPRHRIHMDSWWPPWQDPREVTCVLCLSLRGLKHILNILFSWKPWRQLELDRPGMALGVVGWMSGAVQGSLYRHDKFSFCLERCTGLNSGMLITFGFSELHRHSSRPLGPNSTNKCVALSACSLRECQGGFNQKRET